MCAALFLHTDERRGNQGLTVQKHQRSIINRLIHSVSGTYTRGGSDAGILSYPFLHHPTPSANFSSLGHLLASRVHLMVNINGHMIISDRWTRLPNGAEVNPQRSIHLGVVATEDAAGVCSVGTLGAN